MGITQPTPSGTRDPLRPSARRVVLLLIGGTCCLLAFGVGFAGGLTPIFWREHVRQSYIERALAQDPTIDFASADWIEYAMWSVPDLPGDDLPGYAGEAVLVSLLLAPVVFSAIHILITWLAAGLALRADRRLDLGLGRRPAMTLAAAVMVRVLLVRMPPVCLVCGLVAGLSYIGEVGKFQLEMLGLGWLPLAGVSMAVVAAPLSDVLMSVSAVRRRLQRVAPVESRLCNICGYSLRGLPVRVESCPECGRGLLANRTVVSMVLSPRTARAARWAALAFAPLAMLALAGLLAASPVALTMAVSWATASPGPRGTGLAFVVAPDGAVLKVTDGVATSFFSVRSRWVDRHNWNWAFRARALEAGTALGTWQRHELGIAHKPYAALSVAAPPHTLGAQPWGDRAHLVQVIPNRLPRAISVTFARAEDVPNAEWKWLRAPLPAVSVPAGPAPEADAAP